MSTPNRPHHTARRRSRIIAVLVGVLGSVLLVGPAGGERRVEQDPSVVATSHGAVRGVVGEDGRLFQGIPYAAPPTGQRRWRSPQPVGRWTGVRDATRPGTQCPQAGNSQGHPSVVGSEDCLYLNVRTPRAAAGPRPVLVFLHGGGHVGGQGASYDTTRIVNQGDAVVVTINYRLGVLGFLAHPSLRDPYAGNFGVADQQAALCWVRRNIAAFGGDAGNVTLWGQSAGGRSVCAQLASPAARSLFDKAIVQSSPCANDLLTRREADARGQAAAAKLGCPDAACLRDKTAAELVLSHEPRTVLRARFADYLQWLPVTGTPAVPHQPLDAIRHGATASKQVIFGGTRNEMNVFVGIHYDGRGNPITAEQYPEVLRELYGTRRARAIQDRYPHQQYPSPSLALATAMSDDGSGVGTCRQQPTADAAARHSATYTYEFAQPSGEVIGGLPLGATHSDDLPYFFDGDYPGAAADQPPAGDLKVLADKLIGYWTTFARTGKPGPDWPGYQRGTALSLAVDHIGMTDVARAHQCEFWLG